MTIHGEFLFWEFIIGNFLNDKNVRFRRRMAIFLLK
jgi:hypothetical protein